MRIIAILVIVGSIFSQDLDYTNLPADVVRAIQAYDSNVNKISQRANSEILKEKEKTRKALESAMEKITKSGNLEGALAVKTAIEKLDKADTLVKFDLLGNPVQQFKDGTYRFNNRNYVLTYSNNTYLIVNDAGDKSVKCEILEDKVIFDWSRDNNKMVLELVNGKYRLTCQGPSGNKIWESVAE